MRIAFCIITILSSMAVYSFCSCTEIKSLNRKEYNSYDLIVQGVVTSIEENEHHLKTITLEIKKTYKGEVTEESIKIGTPKRLSYCGLNIGINDEWLIYAYEKDGIFQTDICTRSTPLPPRDFRGDKLEEDINFLKAVQEEQQSSIDFLNSNRGHFGNIVPGTHVEYDSYGYVDSLQFGFISSKKVPGIKIFSTVFSSEENLDYVEVQELQFAEIVEVRQKENHLDLISRSGEGEGAENAQRKVKLCMDYLNSTNIREVAQSLQDLFFKNKTGGKK